MPVTDPNILGLTTLTPGGQVWLAQVNANLLTLRMNWPGGYFGVAGEALAVNDVVAFDSVDQLLYKADSNGANFRFNAVGIVTNAVAIGQPAFFRSLGPHNYAHGQGAGTPLYLSETPGLLTPTAPATPRLIALCLPSSVILCNFPASWKAA